MSPEHLDRALSTYNVDFNTHTPKDLPCARPSEGIEQTGSPLSKQEIYRKKSAVCRQINQLPKQHSIWAPVEPNWGPFWKAAWVQPSEDMSSFSVHISAH